MSKREKLVVLFGSLTGVALLWVGLNLDPPAQAQKRQRSASQEFDPDNFQPKQIVRAFPAIENPPNVTAQEASKHLQPNELILGVELEGVARAYPINMLTGPTREIFNDILGERSIAATW